MDDHTMWNDGINRALKLFCDRVACPTELPQLQGQGHQATHKRKRTK